MERFIMSMEKKEAKPQALAVLRKEMKALKADLTRMVDELERENRMLKIALAESRSRERERLSAAEEDALKRIQQKTRLVKDNRSGLSVCERCGKWQWGNLSPHYCHHCGKPFEGANEWDQGENA
jgi:regulator of replication initiation timing